MRHRFPEALEGEEKLDLDTQVRELREWVRALARRVEELEATAFQLEGEEEVLIITSLRKNDVQR